MPPPFATAHVAPAMSEHQQQQQQRSSPVPKSKRRLTDSVCSFPRSAILPPACALLVKGRVPRPVAPLQLSYPLQPGGQRAPGRLPQQPLAKAKGEVYHMFVSFVMRPIEEIAAGRRVQEATVLEYVADVFLQGHAYPWHRFSVPEKGLKLMLEACEQHLCAPPEPRLQQQPQAGGISCSSGSRSTVLRRRAQTQRRS